ncbi:hypothetical protein DV704_11535 [Meiothermus sp. QL-1]|uniref:DUF6883 domain-containing protein n=1 Tax=Meiothermus sp. QL-1 TaxID=2058095 RepID=UPI000E0C078F|nr:DUF6883 domain-containing protein [Meiothermus sp. QL-1]RDI94511.1 hypothetical protein DV704_11535 [Meiothermus sp. QL-1]
MRFLVPRAKLTEYLLNPKHPEGGSKARFFIALGFSPGAPEALEEALLRHAAEAEEVARRPGFLGQGLVLVLRGPLRSPGRQVLLQSVWYHEEEGAAARLATAYPWKGRRCGSTS